MVADSELGETEFGEGVLRSLHLGEPGLGDVRAVGESARQAGRLGLLRIVEAEGVGQRTNVAFAEAGVDQGGDNSVVLGGDQPRPVIAEVVGVGAVEDAIESLPVGNLIQGFVQRCLAVEAAVDGIRAVFGFQNLVGHDDPMAHAPLLRELLGKREVAAFETFRTRRHGERVVAQRLRGDEGDERAVHPAGVGDQDAAKAADVLLQALVLVGQLGVHRVTTD